MMQVTKVWWDGEKLMAEPIDPTMIYQEPAVQQEPVAKDNSNYRLDPPGLDPLYTSPQPAQRTWVGLTDEERDDLLDNYITAEGRARSIEAKLKEKNT